MPSQGALPPAPSLRPDSTHSPSASGSRPGMIGLSPPAHHTQPRLSSLPALHSVGLPWGLLFCDLRERDRETEGGTERASLFMAFIEDEKMGNFLYFYKTASSKCTETSHALNVTCFGKWPRRSWSRGGWHVLLRQGRHAPPPTVLVQCHPADGQEERPREGRFHSAIPVLWRPLSQSPCKAPPAPRTQHPSPAAGAVDRPLRAVLPEQAAPLCASDLVTGWGTLTCRPGSGDPAVLEAIVVLLHGELSEEGCPARLVTAFWPRFGLR